MFRKVLTFQSSCFYWVLWVDFFPMCRRQEQSFCLTLKLSPLSSNVRTAPRWHSPPLLIAMHRVCISACGVAEHRWLSVYLRLEFFFLCTLLQTLYAYFSFLERLEKILQDFGNFKCKLLLMHGFHNIRLFVVGHHYINIVCNILMNLSLNTALLSQ